MVSWTPDFSTRLGSLHKTLAHVALKPSSGERGHAVLVDTCVRYGLQMRRLVWSEVRDLLSIAAVDSVDDLIFVLEEYRADPPLPDEEVDL